jgi:hypothetical protein
MTPFEWNQGFVVKNATKLYLSICLQSATLGIEFKFCGNVLSGVEITLCYKIKGYQSASLNLAASPAAWFIARVNKKYLFQTKPRDSKPNRVLPNKRWDVSPNYS